MVEFFLAAVGFAVGVICGVFIVGLATAAKDGMDESEGVSRAK